MLEVERFFSGPSYLKEERKVALSWEDQQSRSSAEQKIFSGLVVQHGQNFYLLFVSYLSLEYVCMHMSVCVCIHMCVCMLLCVCGGA